jgi:hypothetical protein
MGSRLGHDFGEVRVHTDARAAESARALDASAYTVGRDVVFGTGRYAPGTGEGRWLLAHELAHVAQQRSAASAGPGVSRAGDPFETGAEAAARLVADLLARGTAAGSLLAGVGAPPAVQRKGKDEALRQAALDGVQAGLIEAFYGGGLEYDNPATLVRKARKLYEEDFRNPDGPRTQAAAARALVAIHRALVEREREAPRDPSGALLYTDIVGGLEPWTPERPHEVEEIVTKGAESFTPGEPLFSPENLEAWVETVAASAEPVPAPKPTGKKKSRTGKATPKPAPKESVPAAPAAAPSVPSAVSAEDPTALPAEEGAFISSRFAKIEPDATDSAIRYLPEVSQAVSRLQGLTIANALDAISANSVDHIVKPVPGEDASYSLFDVVRSIVHVNQRATVLDRSGFLGHEELSFVLKGKPPAGVYFTGNFTLTRQVGGTWSSSTGPVIFQVGGGLQVVRPAGGGPLVEGLASRDREALKGVESTPLTVNLGLAIVVSDSQRLGDWSWVDKLTHAILSSPDYMWWALKQEWKRVKDQPWDAAAGVAFELAADKLFDIARKASSAVLGVVSGMLMAQELGPPALMAVYARSKDEVEFAAQGFARWVVEEAIAEVVGGALKGGVAGGEKALGLSGGGPSIPSFKKQLDDILKGRPGGGADTKPPVKAEPAPDAQTDTPTGSAGDPDRVPEAATPLASAAKTPAATTAVPPTTPLAGSEAAPSRSVPTGPRLPDLADQASPTLDEQTPPLRGDEESPTLDQQAPPTLGEPAPDRPDVGVSGRPAGLVLGKLGPADARQRYLRFIEEDPSRESALYYNLDDGTYAVVQGKRRGVSGEWVLDPSVLHEGGPGSWKIVEHFHPGIRYEHRLPSRQDFKAIYEEIGGGALAKSNKSGIRYVDPMTGEFEITTFGYQKGSKWSPTYFWIRFLNDAGTWETKTFRDLPGDKPWNDNSSYKKWFDSLGEAAAPRPEGGAAPKATGVPSPEGAAPSGDGGVPEGVAKGAATVEIGQTKSSTSKQGGSGTGGPGSPGGTGYKHPGHKSLRKKLAKALKKVTKHSLPFDKNPDIQKLVRELQAHAGQGTNDQVLTMLPTVWGGLQNPDLVAAVVADVWSEAQRIGKDPGLTAFPLTNAAISLSLAAGAEVVAIPPRSQVGDLGDITFFDKYVKTGVRFYDLNINTQEHGHLTHLIQDLVVDRALSAAGIPLRAEQFRALLGGVVGGENFGSRIWIALYDAAYGQINEPETLTPLLRTVLTGLE